MPKVYLPDGRVVNFPDSMSQQDIGAAVEQLAGEKPGSGSVEAPKEERTFWGFLGNLASSTGRLLKDTVQGLPTLASIATEAIPSVAAQRYAADPQRALRLVRMVPSMARAVKEGAQQRYGSGENIARTLYEDPAGVLADASTLTGVGATAATARAPRLAGVLRRMERATDPLRAISAPIAKATDVASDVVIGSTLRPPKAVREDFGGTRGVAKAVKREGVYSEASAQKKLNASTAEADALLKRAESEAASLPALGPSPSRGIDTQVIASALEDKPAKTARLRTRLGQVDAGMHGQTQPVGSGLPKRAQRIIKENPAEIPLTEAQTLKREAQDLAYEAAKSNLGLEQQSNSAIARALREALQQRVPEVGPINQRSQRLLGAQRAFSEAQDRPRALTNFLSVLGGGGAAMATGDPTALLLGGLVKAMDSPRAGAMTGIALDRAGRGLNLAEAHKAALLARLLGQEPPE